MSEKMYKFFPSKHFVPFMYRVVRDGHHWGEVEDFCGDAHDDPYWEHAHSVASMKELIRAKGWSITDRNVGEAAMNTWYAYKGLRRVSER